MRLWQMVAAGGLVTSLITGFAASGSAGAQTPFLAGKTVTVGPSTVPTKGDVNPYGVAVVPATVGSLQKRRRAREQLQ